MVDRADMLRYTNQRNQTDSDPIAGGLVLLWFGLDRRPWTSTDDPYETRRHNLAYHTKQPDTPKSGWVGGGYGQYRGDTRNTSDVFGTEDQTMYRHTWGLGLNGRDL